MYAVVVTVSIDPARIEEAQANLRNTVVPMVKGSPGAVSGVWLAPDSGGNGMSVILLDSRESAEAALQMIPAEPGPGVTLRSKEIREVAASF